MPIGMFRSEEGWVQVDYGTGNIPIPRSKYEENKYKPDFDKLPSEAEYLAAEKKRKMMPRGPRGESNERRCSPPPRARRWKRRHEQYEQKAGKMRYRCRASD